MQDHPSKKLSDFFTLYEANRPWMEGESNDSYPGFRTLCHGSLHSLVPKPQHSCLQRGQPGPQLNPAQPVMFCHLKCGPQLGCVSIT